MNAGADVQAVRPSGGALHARPDFAELMERAYVVVAVTSPTRPPRSRVEWLVGDWERGERAIDTLLAHGFLKELEGPEGELRLALGDRRWPVRLPGESATNRVERTQVSTSV